MKKEVTGTLWVLVTIVAVICGGCLVLSLVGLLTYQITGEVQGP